MTWHDVWELLDGFLKVMVVVFGCVGMCAIPVGLAAWMLTRNKFDD